MLGAAVVVTKRASKRELAFKGKACASLLAIAALIFTNILSAAVLPEDRVDVLYHAYDGGGAEIDGPSVLVRKGFADTVSVWGNYYVDMVSSASVDVLATASPYTEERTEYSAGADYLRDKTIMSIAYTNSSESDYDAETWSFGVSQDFFGDLTTISLSYAMGDDEVRRNPDPEPIGWIERRRYGIGISQILTKNWILAANFETVVDQGELNGDNDSVLNNPYRSARYRNSNPGVTLGYTYEPELYPLTRNSDALALRSMYYLPYRAALRFEFRSFSDSWGINANSYELRYTHPIEELGLTLEGKYRLYDQGQADFYDDLFDFPNINGVEFRARDKELSEYQTQTFGLGISYELKPDLIPFVDKSTVNLYWDHIQLDYSNFRDVLDVTEDTIVGNEPLYSFNANVIRFFFSFWY